ncbi:MAG: hypothetical protein A2Y93_08285 [Chloroflexi bacterium RBG_13_68_17]|nr:MAG: hypothetical protein A2Y93_08285 [Chloroflexi bacterium RBG_13_68_17]
MHRLAGWPVDRTITTDEPYARRARRGWPVRSGLLLASVSSFDRPTARALPSRMSIDQRPMPG